MSETDSFIDEVTEEVRRDRLFLLMRRYGWIGLVAVGLIVGGAGLNEWRKAQAAARAEGFGDAIMAAMQASDRSAALKAITADGAQVAVQKMLLAADAAEKGDTAGARDLLAQVAADDTLSPALRDGARIKAMMLAGPEMPAADRDAALASLAMPGAPYRLLALELQVQALLDAGKSDGAQALSQQILQEPEVTGGMRRRIGQVIEMLGGDVPQPVAGALGAAGATAAGDAAAGEAAGKPAP